MSAVDETLPRRRRVRILTPASAIVLALVVGAIGFYIGVRIEKGHTSSSATLNRFSAAATRQTAGAGGFPGAGGGAGGFTARAGFGGGGAGTAGTVTSVKGRSLELSETGGNTVTVKLTSTTKISKSESVGRGSVRPGDTITVTGASSRGVTTAATVTDSGNSGTSTRSSTSGGSSSGGGVSSLFGG